MNVGFAWNFRKLKRKGVANWILVGVITCLLFATDLLQSQWALSKTGEYLYETKVCHFGSFIWSQINFILLLELKS